MSPTRLKRELSHVDYIKILAHHALEDPKAELEKEINYETQVEKIMRERAERNNLPPA
jgi:hypothetical protein